ncbi:Copper amine oxidase, N2/N3-terminal [Corchorus olitorius]|uniref:Copper amine oxidase, N2/N3-terminal n=1 Tax=Corchorus olitorius TaxID=93759 RepID=A0A1R3KT23_9ROSI|nr:Copper amine oxidase, N2/N3-terminal [Corchorus olitorius]
MGIQNGGGPGPEGLTMMVDLDKMEVVKILDTGRGIPIPKSNG